MRQRTYAAAALALVVGLFAGEYYVLAPRAEDLRGRISSRYAVLQKNEQIVKDAGATAEGVRTVEKEMKDLEDRLIQGKSEFLASARFQEEISRLTTKAGMKVSSMRPLAAVRVDSFNGIPLYVEGNCTITQVSDFLKEAETEKMLIKIDKLSLTITNMQNPRDLKFKIQVSGLARI